MSSIGLAILLAGVAIETRGQARLDRLLVLLAVLGFAPVVHELLLGHVTLPIAATIYLVARRGDAYRNGIPLGVALAIAPKPILALVVVWMLVWRRRALAGAILAAAALTAVALAVASPDAYVAWLSVLLGLGRDSVAGTAPLATHGNLSLWPLDAPKLAAALVVAATALWAILRDEARGFVAALLAGLVLAPYTGLYACTMLLLAVRPALGFAPRATRLLALGANICLTMLAALVPWAAAGVAVAAWPVAGPSMAAGAPCHRSAAATSSPCGCGGMTGRSSVRTLTASPRLRAMSHESLTIVLPAYNEEARLGSALDELFAWLRGPGQAALPQATHVLVVDDGSTDGTTALVRARPEFAAGGISLLPVPHGGKGAAVRAGMLHAAGDLVVFADADMATPPGQLVPLVAALETADAAYGSRIQPDGSDMRASQPGWRRALGRAFHLLASVWVVGPVQDTQCGFKGFRRDVARDVFARQKVTSIVFDVEVIFLVRRRGYTHAVVPIQWSDVRGSRMHPGLRLALRVAWDLFRTPLVHRDVRRSALGSVEHRA